MRVGDSLKRNDAGSWFDEQLLVGLFGLCLGTIGFVVVLVFMGVWDLFTK